MPREVGIEGEHYCGRRSSRAALDLHRSVQDIAGLQLSPPSVPAVCKDSFYTSQMEPSLPGSPALGYDIISAHVLRECLCDVINIHGHMWCLFSKLQKCTWAKILVVLPQCALLSSLAHGTAAHGVAFTARGRWGRVTVLACEATSRGPEDRRRGKERCELEAGGGL